MFVELHILQNFAPANLNRDDTGSPKDCEFGGYRRARISSQCIKRGVRTSFKQDALLPEEDRARRTKRVVEEVQRRLAARGRDEEQAGGVVRAALAGIGITVDKEGKTQYLLYLGEREMAKLSEFCDEQWDAIAAFAPTGASGEGRDGKKEARKNFPAEAAKQLLATLDGGHAADLALFGRMLADLPEHNIDAASQVAHALSTNRVSMEFDYYTAIDDLKPEDTAGADMIGTVEFNSACFYRYANVDLDQLRRNLDGDDELTRKTLDAFIRASVTAIPTGKQNSFAAQNPPSLVFAVVRERGLWSLANAFLQPVRPAEGADLVEKSAEALDLYWQKLVGMYGERGLRSTAVLTHVDDGLLPNLAGARVANLDALVARVMGAVA